MTQFLSQPFRARARTVDMLGRQQIAGIPTAISELFKNSHDAYATEAVVDYFEQSGLFILRDNGSGMTVDDFLNKWLVLGTESKTDRAKNASPPFKTLLPLRPQMGEKGIGRLAISVIGPQMLLLSRANRTDGDGTLLMAFVHWGLYEITGIDLNELKVPILKFDVGEFPKGADVDRLVKSVNLNLDEIIENRRRLYKVGQFAENDLKKLINDCEHIREELKAFNLDPDKIYKALGSSYLKSGGFGTHFFIYPSDPALAQDLRKELSDEQDENDLSQSRIKKFLLGFTNSLTGHGTSFETRFVYRHQNGAETDLIGGRRFWEPEDFDRADHMVEGTFDEYGRFKGKIRVYDRALHDYDLPWPGAQGRITSCGPFAIKFGYVQGVASHSLLDPINFAEMTQKLERIGGLYIYRDGMRIIPYGDNDYDFLEIEKRRTFNAGRAFFSYRRMFGAVVLAHDKNSGLQEKAGREGFRENRAYREFRGMLKYLLEQLSKEYFGTDANQRDVFEKRRDQIEAAHFARKQRDEKVKKLRTDFNKKIDQFFADLKKGIHAKYTKSILTKFRSDLDDLRSNNLFYASRVAEIERRYRNQIEAVRRSTIIRQPSGVGFSTEEIENWIAYQDAYEKLVEDVWQPALTDISTIVQSSIKDVDEEREYVERIKESRAEAVSSVKKVVLSKKEELKKKVYSLLDAIDETFEPEEKNLSIIEKSILESENNQIKDVDERLPQIERNAVDLADTLHQHLEATTWNRTADGSLTSLSQVIADLESELFGAQSKLDANAELVQLGMALEVIDHEFTSSIGAIRHNLQALKAWSNKNPQLGKIYNELRINFDHLDGFLKLFTPLQRRLHREKIDFGGALVGRYLHRLFDSRLKEKSAQLVVSEKFERHMFHGYPSSFYPVFINLVDNALHWIDKVDQPRTIRLDVNREYVTVSDTGPGIPKRDQDRVFELGFSRRTGGRGMGLYIARQSLQREDFLLELLPSENNYKTIFGLRPAGDSLEEKE